MQLLPDGERSGRGRREATDRLAGWQMADPGGRAGRDDARTPGHGLGHESGGDSALAALATVGGSAGQQQWRGRLCGGGGGGGGQRSWGLGDGSDAGGEVLEVRGQRPQAYESGPGVSLGPSRETPAGEVKGCPGVPQSRNSTTMDGTQWAAGMLWRLAVLYAVRPAYVRVCERQRERESVCVFACWCCRASAPL